jgi:hypothetical protein
MWLSLELPAELFRPVSHVPRRLPCLPKGRLASTAACRLYDMRTRLRYLAVKNRPRDVVASLTTVYLCGGG